MGHASELHSAGASPLRPVFPSPRRSSGERRKVGVEGWRWALHCLTLPSGGHSGSGSEGPCALTCGGDLRCPDPSSASPSPTSTPSEPAQPFLHGPATQFVTMETAACVSPSERVRGGPAVAMATRISPAAGLAQCHLDSREGGGFPGDARRSPTGSGTRVPALPVGGEGLREAHAKSQEAPGPEPTEPHFPARARAVLIRY